MKFIIIFFILFCANLACIRVIRDEALDSKKEYKKNAAAQLMRDKLLRRLLLIPPVGIVATVAVLLIIPLINFFIKTFKDTI